jgi:hypothetical protein
MTNERKHLAFKIIAAKKRFLKQHHGAQLQSLPPQNKSRFQQVSPQQPHRGSQK